MVKCNRAPLIVRDCSILLTKIPPQLVLSKHCVPGNGDILLEWRRPRVFYGQVDYYMVYYR
jgi:hypothetical protein